MLKFQFGYQISSECCLVSNRNVILVYAWVAIDRLLVHWRTFDWVKNTRYLSLKSICYGHVYPKHCHFNYTKSMALTTCKGCCNLLDFLYWNFVWLCLSVAEFLKNIVSGFFVWSLMSQLAFSTVLYCRSSSLKIRLPLSIIMIIFFCADHSMS